MKMPKIAVRCWIALAITTLMAATGTFLALFSAPYFSSPTALRPFSEAVYQERQPTSPVPFTPRPHAVLSRFQRTDLPAKVELDFEFEQLGGLLAPYQRFEIRRADADGSFTFSHGPTVRLAAAGFAVPTGPGESKRSYFHPSTLAPLSPEEWDDPMVKILRNLPAGAPVLMLAVEKGELEYFDILDLGLFDAQTHYRYDSRHRIEHDHPDYYLAGLQFHRYHDGPLEVTGLLGSDGARAEFPCQEGATLRLDPFGYEAKVLRVEEVPAFTHPMMGEHWEPAPRNQMVLTPDTGSSELHTLVFISVAIGPRDLGATIRADTGRGNLSAGNRTGNNPYVYRFPIPRKWIKNLVVSYDPPREGAIFTVAGLPGLPQGTRKVDNLFQVRIPYAVCRDRADLQALIEQSVQVEMDFPFFNWTEVNSLTFRDQTAKDALQLVKVPNRAARLYVETPDYQIRVRETWLRRLRNTFTSP